MGTTALIILGVVAVLVLWAITVYNQLVRYRNQVKNGWGQIDVQLQRRYDLIPNLVEAVKGYMAHERNTLEAVIQARNAASAARATVQQAGGPADASIKELLAAESSLQGGLGKLFALAESYPQLKASENMQQLQEELASTENKVAFARQSYNDLVLQYNNAQQVFPTVLIAGAIGHHPVDLFEVSSTEARQAPKVSFS